MKEFALIFRTSTDNSFRPTPAQMQEMLTSWTNWMGGIAAKDKLLDKGSRMGISGSKTIAPGNVITDGPYTEIKEFINGVMYIRAEDIDEAVELAKGCPMLQGGGKVEIRPLVTPDNIS
jgi:hypothetical protein